MTTAKDSTQDQTILGAGFDRRLIGRLMHYLRPRRWAMILLLLVATTAVILNMLWIKIIQLAVDGPIADGNSQALWKYTIVLVACVLAGTGLTLWQNYMGTAIAQRTVNGIRLQLYRHIQTLHMQFYHRNPVGRLLTRVTGDINALNEFFQEGIVSFFTNFLKVIVIMIFMLSTHFLFACITFVCIPLMAWTSIVFKTKSRTAFRETRLSIAQLNSYLQENVSGMQDVQAFNREDSNAERHLTLARDYRNKHWTTIFYFSTFFPLMEFISALGLAIAIGAGAYFYIQNEIEVGGLLLFFFYIEQLFEPIREMADKYNVLQSAMASSERVFKILDTEPTITDPPKALSLDDFQGEIEFRNVWFAYRDEDWVIQDLNLHIKPGEKVAVVGPTGAGKSTLVSLLLRFYDPQRGQILLDGHDLREYSLSSLRGAIGMVLQDPFLFRGTIRDNIRLGNTDFSDDAVQQACRYVGMDATIQSLAEGYDTEVIERGANLSVGQRQLLSMARALVHNPNLLILDEATSHVDPETEAQLQTAMQTLIHDRNVIVIAHRLATVHDVDTIFVLQHGQLAEQGSHNELLQADGLYSTLYQMQHRGTVKNEG